tara:strand:- start:1504 stop:2523 length:1020 start_codon:yes stop_codon:yes gene_type:complete
MKLAIKKQDIIKLTEEVFSEYAILNENPFADAEGKDGEAEPAEDGDKEEEKDKPSEKGADSLTVKFEPSNVKKYNSNTDWRSGEGVVKSITKKGIEVEVDGAMVVVNFDDLLESVKSYYKKKDLREEDEKLSPEDDQEIKDLDQAMGSSLKAMAAAFDTDIEDVKAEVDELPEKPINEAIGTVAVIGMLLAAPKVVELITKGMSKLIKLFKKVMPKSGAKTDDDKKDTAAKIIEFTHKWHKMYIKGVKGLLKISGLFRKAGITDPAAQEKTAKVVYYTIVAGLAVYSGIGAISAFKDAASIAPHASSFEIGTLEAVMAAIKSGEVVEFMGELGLIAAEG